MVRVPIDMIQQLMSEPRKIRPYGSREVLSIVRTKTFQLTLRSHARSRSPLAINATIAAMSGDGGRSCSSVATCLRTARWTFVKGLDDTNGCKRSIACVAQSNSIATT